MTDRISLLIRAKNLSAAQFADEIGVQRSSISHLMSGRNKPSLDLIQKTLQRFPEVSTEWLLFGKGEMVRELNLFNAQVRPFESGSDGKLPFETEPLPADAGIEPLFYSSGTRDADSAQAAKAVREATAESVPPLGRIAMPFAKQEDNTKIIEAAKESLEDSDRPLGNTGNKKGNAINQIIVLYDDRTFMAYSPGN